ncbi:hypothetical protein THASP1DRAFT_7216, partial [Thamnocephalis sphaerospora]
SAATIAMPLPNFRRIYASFRTPEEERRISREAFFKCVGFVVACVAITWLASRQRSPGSTETLL